MGAFIGYGDIGVWANNRERDAFLDWFADHRCEPGDSRWLFCKSEGNRWSGCGVELENLIPQNRQFAVTADEYDQAATVYWPHVAQLLGIIETITRGDWRIGVGNRAAMNWRRPEQRAEWAKNPCNWSFWSSFESPFPGVDPY